jgi:serine/threonine protein kinase
MSSINNLHVVKTLNKGAFAEVYQAIEISTGRAVALKVVRLRYNNKTLTVKT